MDAYPSPVGVPLHSTGVDYCTVTARDGERASRLEDLALRLGVGYQRAGYAVKARQFQGYTGWTAGGLTYGTRPDGALLRMSGWTARYWWHHAVPLAHNVTRLDVEVTIDGGPLCSEVAEVHEAEAVEAARHVGRPVKVQLVREHEGGQTLYLGSRTSQVFRRCYDKAAELPGEYPPGSWRYEVEYKAETAATVARAMLDTGALESAVPGLVHRQFTRCGVTPLFDFLPTAVSDRYTRQETDVERQLRWLREDVSRTVRSLTARGYGDLALAAVQAHAR